MTDADATLAPAQSRSNLAALEHAYRRWHETKGGSVDTFLELFADEVEMRSVLEPHDVHEVARPHSSKAETRKYFEASARDWEMNFYDVDRFIADASGNDIVMVGRTSWRHRERGTEINTPKVDIWHFENGKATQFMEFYDTLDFARALGAVSTQAAVR